MQHERGWIYAGYRNLFARHFAVKAMYIGPSSPRWRLLRLCDKSIARRGTLPSIVLALSVWGGSPAVLAAAPACVAKFPLGYDEPQRQGVDIQKLLELTQWLRNNPTPILSLIISRNGKVVYELYSSRLDHDAAHYLMSVTKSVTSALVGAAIERHLIKAANTDVAENLPRAIFPGTDAYKQFHGVTLKDVLGMSALDA